MKRNNDFVRQVAEQKYEFGFTTDVHTEIIEKGLNEDVVRLISAKKGEPQWMLDFRLQAFRHWQQQSEPRWGHVHVPPIDYQAISYYADPTARPAAKGDGSGIDPELALDAANQKFERRFNFLEKALKAQGISLNDATVEEMEAAWQQAKQEEHS